jgi:hypothetical protein
MENPKLMLIQPLLAEYRIHFFNKLSKKFNTSVFCEQFRKQSGHANYSKINFKVSHTKILKVGEIYYQKGLIKGLFRISPDLIFITAHPKNIALWLILIIAKLKKIPVFLHGQGFYDKPNASIIIKKIYALMIFLSEKYVCYNELSKQSLSYLSNSTSKKLEVAENTIHNNFVIKPSAKTNTQLGILYLGRVRDECNLELLADAVLSLNENNKTDFVLHVIGEGNLYSKFVQSYEKHSCIKFYGAIYDQKVISDIAQNCFIGCYPGKAGLSVVHYMSLSLPAIVHVDNSIHMGPEPSYIVDGYNGFRFKSFDENSIAHEIYRAYEQVILLKKTETIHNSFSTYQNLNQPDFADKLIAIFRKSLS